MDKVKVVSIMGILCMIVCTGAIEVVSINLSGVQATTDVSEANEESNVLAKENEDNDIFSLLDILDAKIQCLPDEYFKPPAEQRKNAFHNKIMAAKSLLLDGNYVEFIDKMENDIKAKMDGCVGGNPSNDWILNASAQMFVGWF
ncbi:MAG: hypothetical protein ACPL1Y_07370 [Thermoplasmata archaeon]